MRVSNYKKRTPELLVEEVDIVKTCTKRHVSKVNFYVLKASATE